VVLRYEQILHTLQTAVDDGKKYTAELNATMGRDRNPLETGIVAAEGITFKVLQTILWIMRTTGSGKTSIMKSIAGYCRLHRVNLW
jgi:ABC-type lipoprotein export system ATPase subunit